MMPPPDLGQTRFTPPLGNVSSVIELEDHTLRYSSCNGEQKISVLFPRGSVKLTCEEWDGAEKQEVAIEAATIEVKTRFGQTIKATGGTISPALNCRLDNDAMKALMDGLVLGGGGGGDGGHGPGHGPGHDGSRGMNKKTFKRTLKRIEGRNEIGG